jgi:hypothetical protein
VADEVAAWLGSGRAVPARVRGVAVIAIQAQCTARPGASGMAWKSVEVWVVGQFEIGGAAVRTLIGYSGASEGHSQVAAPPAWIANMRHIQPQILCISDAAHLRSCNAGVTTPQR